MKKLTTLILLSAFSLVPSAFADSILRTAYYHPETETVTLYLTEDGFQRMETVPLDQLPESYGAAIKSAITAAMPDGADKIVGNVILEPKPDASINVVVSASGPKGQRTEVVPVDDATKESRETLEAVFSQLEKVSKDQPVEPDLEKVKDEIADKRQAEQDAKVLEEAAALDPKK